MTTTRVTKILSLFSITLCATIFAGCKSDTVTGPSSYTGKVEIMDALLDSIIQNTNVPGLVVAYRDDMTGFTYTRSRGYADLARKTPMDAEKLFRIGSLTKTFTSTVILQLVDERKIYLEDKLSKFFPAVPHSALVTIRQLADMSSGYSEYFDTEEFQQKVANDPSHAYTPDELIGMVSSLPLKFTPGAQFDYCNTNYILLGMIIEKVTRNSVAEEIWKRISIPLGLKNTKLLIGRKVEGDFCRGYGYESTMLEKYPPDFTEMVDVSSAWSAGSMMSSMEDLIKFSKALGLGTLISPEVQTERLKYRILSIPRYGYGIGVMHIDNYVGHQGTIYGFNSIMLYNKEKGRTIVVYVNIYSNFMAQFIAENLMDRFGVRD